MIPKSIEFLKDLPKSPNGKIDKKVLKQQILDL
jgi:acyl-coenzyme A synthetase/AMP-(fatty) acid ligase